MKKFIWVFAVVSMFHAGMTFAQSAGGETASPGCGASTDRAAGRASEGTASDPDPSTGTPAADSARLAPAPATR